MPDMGPAEWVAYGVDRGWCSFAVCDTHDGVPMTDSEETAWEEGNDPCIPVLRLWTDNMPDGEAD